MDTAVEFGKGVLEHLAVTRAAGRIYLLQDPRTRQSQTFELTFANTLVRRQSLLMGCLVMRGFGLLLFNGFTFPATRHLEIIRV